MSDEQFDQIISEVMNELPSEYIDNLKNVAIVIADEPTQEQRQKQKMKKTSMAM